jgi:hypothetical protein
VSIGPAQTVEGSGGTTPLTFTVSLSAVSGQTVTVQYATQNGTATAGSDYQAVTGTATIPAGSTSTTVGIAVIGDLAVEGDETMSVVLSAPANATLGTATGIGTILNDDAGVPQLSIADVAQAEGTGGMQSVVATVTLAGGTGSTVTVAYR